MNGFDPYRLTPCPNCKGTRFSQTVHKCPELKLEVKNEAGATVAQGVGKFISTGGAFSEPKISFTQLELDEHDQKIRDEAYDAGFTDGQNSTQYEPD